MVGQLLKRGAVAGGVVLLAETLYAILLPSPDLEEFDPSGQFGDPNKPALKVAVLGDSSVTAPGLSGPEEIWVSKLCTRLGEHFHVELRSYAVGGSKAKDLVNDQLLPALVFAPDLVLIAVGANDAIKGVPVTSFETHLDDLVTAFQSAGARVVLSGVRDIGTIPRLYPPLRNLMTRRSGYFDRVHKSLADRHGAAFVDQRSDDRELWLKDRSMWAIDLFHASARGHDRWAELAWRAVEPLIPELDGQT